MKRILIGVVLALVSQPVAGQVTVGCYHFDRPYATRWRAVDGAEAGWEWIELRANGRLRFPGVTRGGRREAVEREGRWVLTGDTARITSVDGLVGWEFALTSGPVRTLRGRAQYRTDVRAGTISERSVIAALVDCPQDPETANRTVFICPERGSVVEAVRHVDDNATMNAEVRLRWSGRSEKAPGAWGEMRASLRQDTESMRPPAVSEPDLRVWREVPAGAWLLELESRAGLFYPIRWPLQIAEGERHEITVSLEPRILC